jgi:predicted phosphodiesterase
MKIYLFVISLLISLSLAMNYICAENINNKIVNNSITNKILSYRMEPFLLTNGTDYKDISHNNTLSLQNFTIALWVKTNQSILSEPAHVINKGGFNTDEKGANMNYGIWFSTNGTIQGGFETESGEDFEINSKKQYNDGNWHFILLSYNGTLLRLDIDGNEISYKQTEGAIPDSTGDQPLRIGANSLEEDKFFTGYIDEVKIWDRGLTNNEIKYIIKENTNRIYAKDGLVLYHNFGINTNKSLLKETTENPKQILKLKYQKNLNLSNNTNFTKNSLSFSNTINKENTSKILSTIANNKTKNNNAINTSIEQSTNNNNNFVFVGTGDWDCNKNTENTVKNIKSKSPDLVVSTGDMSYGDNGDCFYNVVNPIISKLKISLGNHDTPEDGSASLQNEYESYFKLKKPFYSFDYKNTHFIMMDSTHKTSIASPDQQYQFVKQDLEKTSKNPNINWIIVTLHEPFYTNPGKHPPDQGLAKVYHPLFDKYGVDLVLAGHNHWYERTLPLKFNDDAPSSPIVDPEDETEREERISNNDQIVNFETLDDTATINNFDDSDNPTFITIGTAGRKQHDQSGHLPYITSVWDNGFGFLKIDVTKKTLYGEFYANEVADNTGKKVIEPNYLIRDKFAISKE